MTDDEIEIIRNRCTSHITGWDPGPLETSFIRNAHHDMARMIAEVDRLRFGIRQNAATLVKWAVAAGGHTPSAIVASNLRILVGDEPPPVEIEPCP